MILNWLVATTTNEVGVSWFDFYSIGHICMGMGIFLFFSLFYTIPMAKSDYTRVILPLWAIWILTVVLGIAWEFLENILFLEMGLKFEGRQDSIANITTDIIFVGIGGLGSWFFCHEVFTDDKNHIGYYIFGIAGFTIWIVIFLILRYITYKNTPFFS